MATKLGIWNAALQELGETLQRLRVPLVERDQPLQDPERQGPRPIGSFVLRLVAHTATPSSTGR